MTKGERVYKSGPQSQGEWEEGEENKKKSGAGVAQRGRRNMKTSQPPLRINEPSSSQAALQIVAASQKPTEGTTMITRAMAQKPPRSTKAPR